MWRIISLILLEDEHASRHPCQHDKCLVGWYDLQLVVELDGEVKELKLGIPRYRYAESNENHGRPPISKVAILDDRIGNLDHEN